MDTDPAADSAAKALKALSEFDFLFYAFGTPKPTIILDGQEITLAQKRKGMPEDAAFIAGEGATKRVFELPDGRAIALPACEDAITSDFSAQIRSEDWKDIIDREKHNADLLRTEGFLAQQMEVKQVQIGGETIDALVMPSFTKLAEQGIQVRDHKWHDASRGTSRFFGNEQDVRDPKYLRTHMQTLLDDGAKALAHGHKLTYDQINVAVVDTPQTPDHDRSQPGNIVDRNQEMRLFVLDVADGIGRHKPKQEELLKWAEDYVGCAYYNLMAAEDRRGLDLKPNEAVFESMKDEMARDVASKAAKLMADEHSLPPTTLTGGKLGEIITDPERTREK